MGEGATKIGVLSDSDRRLMARVKDLVVQAKVAESLLNAHFVAEYDLNSNRTILADGTIWEENASETASQISAD